MFWEIFLKPSKANHQIHHFEKLSYVGFSTSYLNVADTKWETVSIFYYEFI